MYQCTHSPTQRDPEPPPVHATHTSAGFERLHLHWESHRGALPHPTRHLPPRHLPRAPRRSSRWATARTTRSLPASSSSTQLSLRDREDDVLLRATSCACSRYSARAPSRYAARTPSRYAARTPSRHTARAPSRRDASSFALCGPRSFAPQGPRSSARRGARSFAPQGPRSFAPQPCALSRHTARAPSRHSPGPRSFAPHGTSSFAPRRRAIATRAALLRGLRAL